MSNLDMSITIPLAKEVSRAFRKAPAKFSREADKALGKIAFTIEAESKRRAPVGKYEAGGNLRQSINTRRLGMGSYIVWVNASYGAYVNFGTQPHVIRPRTKRFLAWKKDGKWFRAKQVNHPGTRAQPFFTEGVKKGEDIASKEISKAIDRTFRDIN